MDEVELFNMQESIKWRLRDARTVDLIEELERREGVYVRKLGKGDRFQFHGKGKLLIVEQG